MRHLAVLLGVLFLALGNSLSHAESTGATDPETVVEKLCHEHKGGEGLFFQTRSRAGLDRFFVKDLADLIWKDALAAKGEVGAIEFDPFVGSQDPQVTQWKVQKGNATAGTALGLSTSSKVVATFKDGGKPRSVEFVLDQGKAGEWKVTDIRYPDHSSLRGIFAAQKKK